MILAAAPDRVQERATMRLVELSTAKGVAVWVNPEMVSHVAPADGAGSSMYGDNNIRSGTKIFFAQGSALEVRESLQETTARLSA